MEVVPVPLTADQKSALATMRNQYTNTNTSSFSETEEADHLNFTMDDATFLRYLKARSFDTVKASHLLDSTISWRKSFGISNIHSEEWTPIIQKENETGKMYVRGFDKIGHAIIYMRPKFENTNDHDGNLKHLVYTMERAVTSMREFGGQEKIILLIDYDGYSLFNAPPMKTSMECLSILQNHYPERLHRAYMLRPPWILNSFWAVVSPFIDPITKAKIIMLDESKIKDTLQKEIDLNVLETSVNGLDARPFNSREYLKSTFSLDFFTFLNQTTPPEEK